MDKNLPANAGDTGFLELRRPWGFSPEARRGSQGASRAAPGKSGLHARGEGERVLALESPKGTRCERQKSSWKPQGVTWLGTFDLFVYLAIPFFPFLGSCVRYIQGTI